MASPCSDWLSHARELHEAGFTRREAGKFLRAAFPGVKDRSLASKLTKVFGKSCTKRTVCPSPRFYLTTAPPELVLASELQAEAKREALLRLREASSAADACGAVASCSAQPRRRNAAAAFATPASPRGILRRVGKPRLARRVSFHPDVVFARPLSQGVGALHCPYGAELWWADEDIVAA